MLAAFCVRLALGVIAPLLILPLRLMQPRFARTQFLIALGLMVVVGLASTSAAWWVYLIVGLVFCLALAGSVVWTLDPPPYGRAVIDASLLLLMFLVARPVSAKPVGTFLTVLTPIDGVSSGLLLGGALTAMLVGHSYLISPGLTLTPLNRMIAWLTGSLILRAIVGGIAAWAWLSGDQTHASLNISYWLPVRWLVGILLPLGLTVMAWLTARIRSTQSATGILYVIVICVWLGELVGLILLTSTGYPL